jgi:predicted transcriptional regulator
MNIYKRQIMELEVISEHPYITFKELRKTLKVFSIYLLRDLLKLRRYSLILRSGNKYYFKYRLSYKGYLYLKAREFQSLLRNYIEWERSLNE